MRSQNTGDNWIVMFWVNTESNELNIKIHCLLMPNKLSLEFLSIVQAAPHHYLSWALSIMLIIETKVKSIKTISWFLILIVDEHARLMLRRCPLHVIVQMLYNSDATSQFKQGMKARDWEGSFNHTSNAFLGSLSWHFLPHLWFNKNFNIFYKLGQCPNVKSRKYEW